MKNTSILIADSGSTKTDWILTDVQGSRTMLASAGMNPFYQSTGDIVKILETEVLPRLTGEVGEIHFYGAGCADAKSGKPVYDALSECIPAAEIIEVASDMLGAARGLCGHKPGLACILGTGANNALFDGVHITHSIGSLGFFLGDEGSGSYLGKTLVVQYLQQEMPDELYTQFANTYPEVNRLAVLDKTYRQPFPNRYFAGFSRFIASHIEHPFLQELVTQAFTLFVKKYIKKHRDAALYQVHFTGSVAFFYQDILKRVLLEEGLIPGRIVKSPLEGLTDYHTMN
ncbi:N-acetylglucosamine kinase [Dyadobacter helix]|uniref:N-acetylglucosamine kinase n=1 Tax=Dyadobacter helix TaxID=2822344 RepID=UPI001BFC5D17|nr:N-acetylglucosamine kinase [Dyadobacter sp. CECT 9275]